MRLFIPNGICGTSSISNVSHFRVNIGATGFEYRPNLEIYVRSNSRYKVEFAPQSYQSNFTYLSCLFHLASESIKNVIASCFLAIAERFSL